MIMRYQRHFLETPIDFKQRKLDRSRNSLTVLYWILIGVLLVSLSIGVWIVKEAVK